MRKLRIAIFGACSLSIAALHAVELPAVLPDGHPRVLTTESGKMDVVQLVETKPWAKDVYDKLKLRADKYVALGEDWLASRLQMYWDTHATDVYVKGESYSHAGGEKAPVPTVMYPGARSHATRYQRPKLEELVPYSENPQGLWLRNKSLPDAPYEWAAIANTGSIVSSINVEILGYARDAAFLWWFTGDEAYARLAAKVFDTYMMGIYYRNVPLDLNHGHQQTLVGMTTFEVIHEDALNALVPLYDFLYPYLKRNFPENMPLYAAAFKKWADNIIDNGVPHNNWDLIQSRFIMDIALVLENDAEYADNRGREYYLNKVLNDLSIRQWSLEALARYGFDAQTGIWCECPGYSVNVVADYASFAALFDRTIGLDLVAQLPVIAKAVAAVPQYLFPNRMIVGFGDTHPNRLRTDMVKNMIRNAQHHGKREQEAYFTALLKCLDPATAVEVEPERMPVAVASFFGEQPLSLDSTIPAGEITDYVTATFYAPNVSWLVQRSGMDEANSLMVSLNASEGNHQHANGISMELYGKGYPLAPDAGIGKTLYSGLDYLEYYGQFPSHNTVCVDGVSSYPIMKSNHAFELEGVYPACGQKDGYYRGVTYGYVSFREPETRADQTRLTGIVATLGRPGYYVDVFRSRKEQGGDKMHDYFYHNLGQDMRLTAADGTALDLQPTEELAFAGAHLYAYSYIYDKKMAETGRDVKATFTMTMPDGDDILMTMWQKGYPDRQVFQALSPATEGLGRIKDFPYKVMEQPTLTYVARQKGEAWKRPFVSVFEPYSISAPARIAQVSYFDGTTVADDFIGICVTDKDGVEDYIFSSVDTSGSVRHLDMTIAGLYAVISRSVDDAVYFLAHGTQLKATGVEVLCDSCGDVVVEQKGGKWYYAASVPCRVKIGKTKYRLQPGEYQEIIK